MTEREIQAHRDEMYMADALLPRAGSVNSTVELVSRKRAQWPIDASTNQSS